MEPTMKCDLLLLASIAASLGFVFGSFSSAQDPAKAPKNSVKIRITAKDTVEFDLIGERPFPIVNAAAVLYVGKVVCHMNWNRTGQPTSLTFTMSAAMFAQTRNGDSIVVKYEPDSQGHWDFGKLDKSVVGEKKGS
jgi:hypothetical protein